MFKKIFIYSMEIEGFKIFKDKKTVTFSELNKIQGHNGKGKTSICEAITWGFLGSTLWGNTRMDNKLINKDSKKMTVTIQFTDGNRGYLLKRERRGSISSIILNNKSINQSELSAKLGSKDIFLSIFNMEYLNKKNDKEVRDFLISILPEIEQKDVLNEMFDVSIDYIKDDLDLVHLNPNLYMKEIRANIRELEDNLLFNEGVLSKINIDNESKDLKVFDSSKLSLLENQLSKLEFINSNIDNKEINKLKEEKSMLQNKIINIQAKEFSKIDTLESHKELSKLENELALVKAKEFQLSDEDTKKLYTLESQYQRLKDDYRQKESISLKEGDNCPTCKTIISHTHIEMLKEENEYNLSKLIKDGEDKAIELSSYKEYIEKLKKEYISNKELQIKDLKIKYDTLSQKIKEIDRVNMLNEKTIKSKKEENINLLQNEIKSIDKKINEINSDNKEDIEKRLEKISIKKAQLKEEILIEKKAKAEVDAYNLEIQFNSKKKVEALVERNKILDENNKTYEKIEFYNNQINVCKEYTGIKVRLLSKIIHSNLNDVTIELQSIVKSTGELKDTFNIQYKGVDFSTVSRSEEMKVGLEISNLIRGVTGYNYPLFIDNIESIGEYNVPKDSQVIEVEFIKNLELSITEKYEEQEEIA